MLGPQQSEFRCPCGTVVTGSEQLVKAAVEDHVCTTTEGGLAAWAWPTTTMVIILASFAYYAWGN